MSQPASRSSFGWEVEIDFPESCSRIFDLAHPLEPGIPHAPAHPPYGFTLTKRHGDEIYEGDVSASAELIVMGGHVGTHIDGLGHFSQGGMLHSGVSARQTQTAADGLGVDSVHELAPVLARAHLVDVPTVLGRQLVAGDAVGAEVFEAWFRDRRPPARSDAVLVRTGWSRHWPGPEYVGRPGGCPGVDLSGAKWLSEHNVAVTGTDTLDFERTPTASFPVHVHLLVDCGIPILEALNLDRLLEEDVLEFFLVAVPLPIKGGTGSPLRPLALA